MTKNKIGSDYMTAKEISNKTFLPIRKVQRTIKKIKPKYPENLILTEKNKSWVHSSLLYEFEPIYTKRIYDPPTEFITRYEWDLFCAFTPNNSTRLNILKYTMHELYKYLKKTTKQPLMLYYSVEFKPNIKNHIHYFVKSNYHRVKLQELIKNKLKDLILSDFYCKDFNLGLKYEADDYLKKGKGINFKNSDFIYGEIINSKPRKYN